MRVQALPLLLRQHEVRVVSEAEALVYRTIWAGIRHRQFRSRVMISVINFGKMFPMSEGARPRTWSAPPSAPFDNLHACSRKRTSRFLIRTCLICFPGCRRAQQRAKGSHAHCVGPLKENCKQPSAIGSSQGCASRRARVRGWPESTRSTVLQNIAAEEWPVH